MKAAVVRLPTSLESLSIEDLAEPAIAKGKLKVRWRALSLNFHDYAVVAGMLPAVDGRIPISDGAGEIVAVGEGVSGWAVGDKVMSLFFPDWQDGEPTAATTSRLGGDSTDGCAVEFSLVDPDKLTRIPAGYSYAEAATLPCAALTAWRALVEVGQIKAGDQVLVEGTGGVSIFALQFAKSFGAKVYATSSSPAKLERLKKLGADATVDYRADPNWGEAISQLSDGGVDHVIDVG
uniref:zinc-dependent alcohol dehydrogenase family protein n=1 Tax=uncultured Nevskia sp. TaxID=228950 RepID=UPI0025FC9F73